MCAMSVGKTMDKLSKLLNQAENAATQAEADAFFERAQEWASLHAITLEQARAHTAASQRREEPTHEQVVIGAPRQHVNGHLCMLASAIGQANGLRTNLASNNTFVLWFGLPSDIEKATMLLHAHQYADGALRRQVHARPPVGGRAGLGDRSGVDRAEGTQVLLHRVCAGDRPTTSSGA